MSKHEDHELHPSTEYDLHPAWFAIAARLEDSKRKRKDLIKLRFEYYRDMAICGLGIIGLAWCMYVVYITMVGPNL